MLDGDVYRLAAEHGMLPEMREFELLHPNRVGRDTYVGRTALEKGVVHVPDVSKDPEYGSQEIPQIGGFASILSVPLMREGMPIGVFCMGRVDPGPFTERQIELVQTFADQAVIAIENVRLFEEVQARNRDLTESLERQTAMSDILRVISRSPTDVQPVFETIAESAARLCSARFCTVFRFDGELIHFAAQHGLTPEAIDAQRRAFPMLPGRGSGASRAILSAVVEQIPDVNTDPDYQIGETARAMSARSVLAVPMLRDGRPVGSINLGRPEPGYFPSRQIELLQTFADQAVIAIENVRLFEEVQARTAEVTEALQQQTATADVLKVISRSAFDLDAVLHTLVNSAIRLCGATLGSITLREGDDLRFMAGSGQSPELRAYELDHPHRLGRGSFQGRAAMEGKTIHVPDVFLDAEYERREAAIIGGFRAALSVPLKRGTEVIGVFGLARGTAGPFAPRQIELVESFADQAVIAIENARLFEEVQARTAELSEALQQQTATADVLKVISRSAFNLQPVLQTLVESAIRLCGAEKGVITLREGDDLRVTADSGASPELRAFEEAHPHKLGRGTFHGRAAIEGTTIHIPDALADPEYERKEFAIAGDFRAVLCVPLKRDKEVLGVFGLARAAAGPFTPRQIELVESFADQAVIAVENARLFEEVRAKTRDLEESLTFQKATSSVLEVIGRSASNLQPVLDVILDTAADLCHADMSVLRLMREGTLQHVASSRRNDPVVVQHARENPILPADRSSVAGRVALAGHTIHIPDVARDAEYTFYRTLDTPIGSVLGVPLVQEGKVAGVIALLRRLAQPFTQRQIELVETFADQAVIAIENVRLFEEVQERTREVTEALEQQTATSEVLKVISSSPTDIRPVLDAVGQSAKRLCEANNAVIFLLDGKVLRQVGAYGHVPTSSHPIQGLPVNRDTVTGRAVAEGRSVHVHDLSAEDGEYPEGSRHARIDGHRTTLATPLLSKGVPIGAILIRRMEVRPFSRKHIDLLTTFADQAVIAIENVRLFDEVQARTAELSEALQQQTATADVLQAISRSTFDLDTVLKTLIESAARLCDTGPGQVWRRDGEVYRLVASQVLNSEYDRLERRLAIRPGRESAVARAVMERHAVQIADVMADPEYARKEEASIGNLRTALAVPLLRSGEPIGAFAFGRHRVEPFTDRQVALVETFADQAVIAIENARLFDEVQARTRELSRSLEDLRTAQDRLVQTEKLASLGQLTAGIAHEIKNPLNFVNNFSVLSGELIDELREALANAPVGDKLRAEIGELTNMLKGNFEKVVEHGRRADSIVKNMLLHSRSGSGEHRPTGINAIVEESLNLAYHGARAEKQGFNITMEKSLDPAAGDIDLYPQEITRVLLNLISNGFYAATKRKAQADGSYEPILAASTRNLGDSVEIRIRDNGTGIPPEVKEQMFNPFFTTKPAGEGTGLGLSLSHDIIVKQHAGTIEVETEPGAFTEFRIVLPRGAASLGKSGGVA